MSSRSEARAAVTAAGESSPRPATACIASPSCHLPVVVRGTTTPLVVGVGSTRPRGASRSDVRSQSSRSHDGNSVHSEGGRGRSGRAHDSRPNRKAGPRWEQALPPRTRRRDPSTEVVEVPAVVAGDADSQLIQFELRHPVSVGLRRYAALQGVRLVASTVDSIGVSSHPTLLLDRVLACHVIRDMAYDRIADARRDLSLAPEFSSLDIRVLGGHSSEFIHAGNTRQPPSFDDVGEIKFHCCTPMLSTADACRQRGDCAHVAADCIDMCPGTPLLWLSCHSLYYMRPEEIGRFTLKCHLRMGFACLHEFEPLGSPSGVFLGHDGQVEAAWRREKDGDVVMDAAMNSLAYRHSDMSWLQNYSHWDFTVPSVTLAPPLTYRLAWSRSRALGSNRIFEFHVVDTTVAPALVCQPMPPRPLEDLDRHVREGVSHARTFFMGHEYNQSMYFSINQKLIGYYRGNVPPDRMHEVLDRVWSELDVDHAGVAAAAARVTDAPNWLRRNALIRRWFTGWSRTDQVMRSFRRWLPTPWSISPTAFAVTASVLALGAYSAGSTDVLPAFVPQWAYLPRSLPSFLVAAPVPVLHTPFIPTMFSLWIVLSALFGFAAFELDRFRENAPMLWIRGRYVPSMPPWFSLLCELGVQWLPYGNWINALGEALLGTWYLAPAHLLFVGWLGSAAHLVFDSVVGLGEKPRRLSLYDVCCAARPLSPQRVGSVITPSKLYEPDCTPSIRSVCFTHFVTSHFPVVARRCHHNEVVAVRNRVLMVVPFVDPLFWTAASNLLRPILSFAPRLRVTWTEWLKRFPMNKQARLAPSEIASTGPTAFTVSPMLKLEHVLKGTNLRCTAGSLDPCEVGDVELFDPRVISVRKDAYQAKFGPYCVACSDSLKSLCDCSCNITYACGMSVAQLGNWMSKTLMQVSRPVFLQTDFSRFDATISTHALRFQYRMMSLMFGTCLPEAEADLTTRAWFSSGLYYSVEGTRKSGNSDTSVGNSLVNIGFWCVVLHRLKIPLERCRVIIMGDDSLVAIPSAFVYTDQELTDAAVKAAEGSGLVLKIAVVHDWRRTRFCSCRFFHLRRGDIRCAQCPGRYLAKGGWALSPPDSARYQYEWIRAATYCLVACFAHVPVMRALALLFSRHVFGCSSYADMSRILHEHKDDTYRHGFEHWMESDSPPNEPLVTDDPDIMTDFAFVYDLDPVDLTNAEEYILALPFTLPIRLDHWVLECLVEADV